MILDFSIARRRMVDQQIRAKGVTDSKVLEAMLRVPRHLFVEEGLRNQAYSDFPLPIGDRQTISQPFMVACMTEALQLNGDEHVLEIGTGSGYQAAVLACIVRQVFSIERLPGLARSARQALNASGIGNVQIRIGDGSQGWPEQAPFDAIVVTAGAPAVPETLLQQLKEEGRLVIPVGDRLSQELLRVTRHGGGRFRQESLLPCRFVPLIGQEGWDESGRPG